MSPCEDLKFSLNKVEEEINIRRKSVEFYEQHTKPRLLSEIEELEGYAQQHRAAIAKLGETTG